MNFGKQIYCDHKEMNVLSINETSKKINNEQKNQQKYERRLPYTTIRAEVTQARPNTTWKYRR